MKTAKELVAEYLPNIKTMQLGTAKDNQPWVCTVHYFSDEDFNLYWISTAERRHSQELKDNPNVAATIAVHINTDNEPYVIGVTLEGKAELVGREIDEKIGAGYITKTGRDESVLEAIRTGQNPHQFYKMTPQKIVLFDTKNFEDNPRQEIDL